MGKMKLDVSELKVETFTAGEDRFGAALLDCTERDCSIPCIVATCEEYAC
ncbi:MAG: hypothetical protein KY467_01080 [Gemmatimonadetes bacterium]|nr:hypothetical protein [Gemmatimonadota bacterium]